MPIEVCFINIFQVTLITFEAHPKIWKIQIEIYKKFFSPVLTVSELKTNQQKKSSSKQTSIFIYDNDDDHGSRIKDQISRIINEGSRIKDQGSRVNVPMSLSIKKKTDVYRRTCWKWYILVESRSWRDRNLKFGPNCDLRWIIWKKMLSELRRAHPGNDNLFPISISSNSANSDPGSKFGHHRILMGRSWAWPLFLIGICCHSPWTRHFSVPMHLQWQLTLFLVGSGDTRILY